MKTLYRLLRGATRAPLAILAALAATWLGLALTIDAAGAGALVGGLTVLTSFSVDHVVNHVLHASAAAGPFQSGADAAFLLLATLAGMALGAAGGLAAAAYYLLLVPDLDLRMLVTGAALTLPLAYLCCEAEPLALRLWGRRRLAQHEDARVWPLAAAAGRALGLRTLPTLLIEDTPLPSARAHVGAIVLSRGLLDALDDDQLAGVLAHELAHWRACDPAAGILIAAAALPLAVTYVALAAVVDPRSRVGLLALPAWIFYLPVAVVVRLVIAPVAAWEGRWCEYAADAAAARAGEPYRAGLRSALEQLGQLDVPVGTWERALIRSHPPTALRLERLLPEAERLQWDQERAGHGKRRP